MLYGDRGYCIAHAHSRRKEALRRASTSKGRDEHSKEENSGIPERLGAGDTGRGVSALRLRRLRRTT